MPTIAIRHLRAAARAADTLARLAPVLDARGAGRRQRSLRQVAALLNESGVAGPAGGLWWPEGVRRALAEAERARVVLVEGWRSGAPRVRTGSATRLSATMADLGVS